MPGFSIVGNEGGPSASLNFYTSYEWTIRKLGPIDFKMEELQYVQSVILPTTVFEEQIVKGASSQYKFAKAITHGDIEVVFYDIASIYLDKIFEWQELIWTEKSGIGAAHDYMGQSVFELFAFKGSGDSGQTIPYVIKAENTWPKSIVHSNLTYAESEIKKITLTLATSHISASTF